MSKTRALPVSKKRKPNNMTETIDGELHYRADEVEIDKENCRIRVPDHPNWINVNKEHFNSMPDGRIVEVRLGICEHGIMQATFGIIAPELDMCICRCDCGREVRVSRADLLSGRVKACEVCINKETYAN
jgi:hypothetical protein